MHSKPIHHILLVIAFTLTHSCILFAQDNTGLECFMIMAGKGATVDGSVLVAHNNDLTGKETSFVEKIPRQHHNENEVITFPSGLKIPQVKETFAWMVLRVKSGYAEGDAIAINEYGVAIGGGVALGDDRNKNAALADPLVKEGLTGGIRYVALERSQTARECVEMLGSFYTRYGVTYPSGVSIADVKEVWYIEAGGGHTWTAVRIPDNKFMAVANGYRIGEINVSDSANVLTSPNLLTLAKENNLWNPDDSVFNFAETFGGGRENRFYDTRRVWRGITLLSSINVRSEDTEFPMFITPNEKLDLTQLTNLLRDKYADTPFENVASERTICINRTVHSSIVQLRNWLPVDTGAILWTCLSVPTTSIYIPFYFGVEEIHPAFNTSSQSISAFGKFRSLYEKSSSSNEMRSEVQDGLKTLETKIITDQIKIENEAEKKPISGNYFPTNYVMNLCETVMQFTTQF